MAAGQEWRNSNSTILPLQTSLAFASTDQLPSKVPDIRNPSHYVLGSGAGWLWLSRGVAVNNYFNLFIIWEMLAKLQSACWKSVESVKELDCYCDPQGAHLQSWQWPFSLDICDLWAMAAHESKLNTSNRRHFHLREMRCCPCFRNSAARSKRECFRLEMIRRVCVSPLQLAFTTM